MAGVEDRVQIIWARKLVPVFTRLSTNIAREICLFLPSQLTLACIDKDNVCFFDFQTLQLMSPVSLTRSICTFNASWATVDADRVIVCEGGDNGNTHSEKVLHTALLLHRSGRVEDLTDMKFPHNNSGVIAWRGRIHVFGSYCGPGGEKCERLPLFPVGSAWEQLPDMQFRRALFTPVVWNSAVYLCGGYENSSIEAFNGETMQLLSISLPQRDASPSLACLKNTTLLVFTSNFLVKISMQGTDFTLTTNTLEIPNCCTVYTNPVYWKNVVFNCELGNVVNKYSASDGRVI